MRENIIGEKLFPQPVQRHEVNIKDKPLVREMWINADFEAKLEKNCETGVLEFIKKDKFTKESLLWLFSHHEASFRHSIETSNAMSFVIKGLDEKYAPKESPLGSDKLLKAAVLHDYGKLIIDEELLDKKESLTEKDAETLKTHVRPGFEGVYENDPIVAAIIAGHHEFQEKSYPRKESRDSDNPQIKRFQRILALVDSYEAMLAERPGNPAKKIEEVMGELEMKAKTPEDHEVVLLLYGYYLRKNPEQRVDAAFN